MSLQAWMGARVCVCVCVSMCVCLWLRPQTFPGGKHGCSLLFSLLFQITVCFINAMVNLLSPPLLVPLLCETDESSKDTHWSKRLLRPHATQPVSTVSIFYECFCSKVVVGELRTDNMIMTKGWKHDVANGGMTGPSDWLHCQLVFLLYTIYGAVNIWCLGAHLIFLSIIFPKFFLLVNPTLFFSPSVMLQLISYKKWMNSLTFRWYCCINTGLAVHALVPYTIMRCCKRGVTKGVHVGPNTSFARTHKHTHTQRYNLVLMCFDSLHPSVESSLFTCSN